MPVQTYGQGLPPGQTVLVLGAAGALGSGLAAAFVAAGAAVVGLDRGEPGADRAVAGARYLAVDLADEDALAAAFAQAAAAGTAPWAVVNTVGGFAPGGPVADLDLGQLAVQLQLNLTVAAAATKHALRIMLPGGRGRIVHTGSRAGAQPAGSGLAYSLSKAALHHLVERTAEQTRGTGVTINAVLPSVIDTPANRAALPHADHSRWPRVEELAPVYLFLTSLESALVNGALVPAYGAA